MKSVSNRRKHCHMGGNKYVVWAIEVSTCSNRLHDGHLGKATKIQQTLVYRADYSRSIGWHDLSPIAHPPPLLVDEDRHGC